MEQGSFWLEDRINDNFCETCLKIKLRKTKDFRLFTK
jgi:hypothetical protein